MMSLFLRRYVYSVWLVSAKAVEQQVHTTTTTVACSFEGELLRSFSPVSLAVS